MKANETPEKIYLQPSTIEELPHQNIVYTKPLADNSIEYTRTDAFIKKAVQWIKNNMELIDKSLVAEINQRIEDYKSHKIDDSYHDGLIFALEDLRDDFINTLEVKEVDLEKEIDRVWNKTSDNFLEDGWKEFENIAKHFFELGLKAQKGE